jgi:hypothetical protein
MLCGTCHGKGTIVRDGRPRPCEECGGFGVLHCCEGLQVQSADCAPRPPLPVPGPADVGRR